MGVHLIRFEQLLVELGQDAKTEHQRMLAEAYRCLYIMNARAMSACDVGMHARASWLLVAPACRMPQLALK